jgi:ATP-dependent DNA helicase RecG
LNFTPEKLTQPHESKPWNPIIANVFYRAGIIERWGTGTLNIIDWCKENANPSPSWREQADSVYVSFLPAALPDTPPVTPPGKLGFLIGDRTHPPQVTGQVSPKSVLSLSQVCPKSVPSSVFLHLLGVARDPATIDTLMKITEHTNRTRFRKTVLRPLLDMDVLTMTIPDKPRSSKQKYRLTEKGNMWLKSVTSGG